jgi:hypothetical protein
MRAWALGTEGDDWVSMAVVSDGSYGIEKGLFYSFPVRVAVGGEASIVNDLKIDVFAGLPVTNTFTCLLATAFNALPCSAKITALLSSKSFLFIPVLRGFAPTKKA